MDIAGLKNAG